MQRPRLVKMVQAGAIITETGTVIPTRIDTICLHGDGPDALAIAHATRDALAKAAITLAQCDGAML